MMNDDIIIRAELQPQMLKLWLLLLVQKNFVTVSGERNVTDAPQEAGSDLFFFFDVEQTKQFVIICVDADHHRRKSSKEKIKNLCDL